MIKYTILEKQLYTSMMLYLLLKTENDIFWFEGTMNRCYEICGLNYITLMSTQCMITVGIKCVMY